MKYRYVLLALPVLLLTAAPVYATEQEDYIADNCTSLKQSLRNLQKSDSATRVHLGTTYQTILNQYLVKLNTRLVRGNLSNPALINLQTDFAAGRTDFSDQFIRYSQELEALIAIDCHQNPAGFYEQLQTTRAARARLAETTEYLNSLVQNHHDTVVDLKEELKNGGE